MPLISRTIDALPDALSDFELVEARLDGRPPVVFLDYDGTLSPIVDRPGEAHMPTDMRTALADLAERAPTVIVSGRGLDVLQGFVALDSVHYAGDHGLAIAGADGTVLRPDAVAETDAALPDLLAAVETEIGGVPGVLIEPKRHSVAVHYRLADAAARDRVVDAAHDMAARFPAFRVVRGKMVEELRPDIDWDKGVAVAWLRDRLDPDRDHVPVYVGDDLTDEDAFRVLDGEGVSVVVGHGSRDTLAEWRLAGVGEVRHFLERLGRRS
jgi:trehalose-phosphatase